MIPRGPSAVSLPAAAMSDKRMPPLSAAAAEPPFTFAGFPLRSWAFGIRIWLAAVIALLVSFWLQLEAPSSAMLTVMILAEPTRGQALAKAGYRLIATAIGVVASLVIVGALSQARDLLLLAFALWMGLCIYACYLFDGYRAYAAVLSGYTVALVAIQQIDNPQHVFAAAMDRGAGIAVGVLSITLVNDLLLAPDRHPQLGVQLAELRRRVRDYARAVLRGEATDALAVAALIRGIVALRPDIASLAAESSSGPVRSAAARSAMVALVAELQAARALAALPPLCDPALREELAAGLGRDAGTVPQPGSRDGDVEPPAAAATPQGWALHELLRRDAEIGLHLVALREVLRPQRSWRAPLYRSQRIAIENGVRAVACVAAAAVVFVLAGWSSASAAFALAAVILGLGATTPSPRGFTALGFLGTPMAVLLTGILEFVVLEGTSDFPLLALGLAPFLIGAALMVTLPNPALSGLGKVNLIFISAIFAASNPQTYNPQSFLFTALFISLASGVLLAAQFLIPPVTDSQRRGWLLASARHDLGLLPSCAGRRYAPEEAAFRDAVRIGQITAAGPAEAAYRMSVEQALAYFDQAAAIRLSAERLAGLTDRAVAEAVAQAQAALSARDPHLIRAAAGALRLRAAGDEAAAAACAALAVAGAVLDRPPAGTPERAEVSHGA